MKERYPTSLGPECSLGLLCGYNLSFLRLSSNHHPNYLSSRNGQHTSPLRYCRSHIHRRKKAHTVSLRGTIISHPAKRKVHYPFRLAKHVHHMQLGRSIAPFRSKRHNRPNYQGWLAHLNRLKGSTYCINLRNCTHFLHIRSRFRCRRRHPLFHLLKMRRAPSLANPSRGRLLCHPKN